MASTASCQEQPPSGELAPLAQIKQWAKDKNTDETAVWLEKCLLYLPARLRHSQWLWVTSDASPARDASLSLLGSTSVHCSHHGKVVMTTCHVGHRQTVFQAFMEGATESYCLGFVTKDHNVWQCWSVQPSPCSPPPGSPSPPGRGFLGSASHVEASGTWRRNKLGDRGRAHVSLCWGPPPQRDNAHYTSIFWLATGMICNSRDEEPAVWLSFCLFSLKWHWYKATVELWQHRN